MMNPAAGADGDSGSANLADRATLSPPFPLSAGPIPESSFFATWCVRAAIVIWPGRNDIARGGVVRIVPMMQAIEAAASLIDNLVPGVPDSFFLDNFFFQSICFNSGEIAASTVSGHRSDAQESPTCSYVPSIRVPSVGAQLKGETR